MLVDNYLQLFFVQCGAPDRGRLTESGTQQMYTYKRYMEDLIRREFDDYAVNRLLVSLFPQQLSQVAVESVRILQDGDEDYVARKLRPANRQQITEQVARKMLCNIYALAVFSKARIIITVMPGDITAMMAETAYQDVTKIMNPLTESKPGCGFCVNQHTSELWHISQQGVSLLHRNNH
jgi:hypothetical protein